MRCRSFTQVCIGLCGGLIALLTALILAPTGSLLCHGGHACDVSLEVERDSPHVNVSLGTLLRVTGMLLHKRWKREKVVYVAIGATVEDEADTMLPKSILSIIPSSDATFIFLQPDAQRLEAWRELVGELGINGSNAHFVNAALCAESAERVPFYQAAAHIRDKHAPAASLTEVADRSTTSRSQLIRSLRSLSPGVADLPIPDLEAFVEEASVRCLSPAALLREAGGITPGQVDFILIDALGHDGVKLMSMFLALGDAFAPSFATFGWRGDHDFEPPFPDTLRETLRALAARSLAVHRHADDIMAFATR